MFRISKFLGHDQWRSDTNCPTNNGAGSRTCCLARRAPGWAGKDNRLFVDGVLWVLRSGAGWSYLPELYGEWKTVHKRLGRWTKSGAWERVFDSLTGDPDNQYLMLDITLVRAHPAGRDRKRGDQNQALGRSRGGLTRKIHALADASGLLCCASSSLPGRPATSHRRRRS